MNKITAEQITYLVIPFEEKDRAVKAAGRLKDGSNAITFDGENKLWYAKAGADLSRVSAYLPNPDKTTSTTAESDPRVEFTQHLEKQGFQLKGLAEMNGAKQRVKTDKDKNGQKSGVYVGYLDGIPAGWYQDFRKDSEPVKWKSTGQALDKEAQEHLRAIMLQRKQERLAQQINSYDHHAARVAQAYALMPDATDSNAYLIKKGVKAFSGAKEDKQGRLVLPIYNENGDIRTLQRISENSFKSLKKGGQKTGNFLTVGDGELVNGEPILYAEGYSTSASIAEATGRNVVMAIDAGNLPSVAQKLKERYPDSPHVFLGDDDHKNETNKGKEKASESAELTGGVYGTPKFSKEEMAQGLTDFNDLHQAQGLEEVRKQVESIVSALNKSKNSERKQPPIMSEAIENQSVESELSEINTVEPQPQAKKELLADKDARAWKDSSRRKSLQELLAQQNSSLHAAPSQPTEAEADKENQPAELAISTQKAAEAPKVPDTITKRYIEHKGKYYFSDRPDSLAFVDKVSKLQTKSNDAHVASSMVELAESRGWSAIKLKGTEEFRREAWLAAASKGLIAEGYQPNDGDLSRLKQLMKTLPTNEVSNQTQQAKETSNQTQQAKETSNQTQQANATPSSEVNRFTGVVVKHGNAPYEHNKDNNKSYFVTLENDNGGQTTTWGVDLERAMSEKKIKTGDRIELENLGRKPVTIQRPVKDEQGATIRTEEVNTYRNRWEVKTEALKDLSRSASSILQEHPDLLNEVAVIKVAQKFSERLGKDHERARFMDKVSSTIAANLEQGQKINGIKIREEKAQTTNKEIER